MVLCPESTHSPASGQQFVQCSICVRSRLHKFSHQCDPAEGVWMWGDLRGEWWEVQGRVHQHRASGIPQVRRPVVCIDVTYKSHNKYSTIYWGCFYYIYGHFQEGLWMENCHVFKYWVIFIFHLIQGLFFCASVKLFAYYVCSLKMII